MSVFNVELVKKVDDSYDIEIGFGLMDKLVADLSAGLAGWSCGYAGYHSY